MELKGAMKLTDYVAKQDIEDFSQHDWTKDLIVMEDRRIRQCECFMYACPSCFPNWEQKRKLPYSYKHIPKEG